MGHEEGGEQDSHNWRHFGLKGQEVLFGDPGKKNVHIRNLIGLLGFTNRNVFSPHTFLEILQAYNTLHKVNLLLSFMMGQTYNMANMN